MIRLDYVTQNTKKESIKTKRLRKKYPDTPVFTFYNANPLGKITGDCIVRALSTALKQTWEETYRELVELGINCGYSMGDKKNIERYLKSKGFYKHKQPKNEDGTKLTGVEFCGWLQATEQAPYVNVIANIGTHHIVAIINGKVQDTWDSSDGCIGNYWTESEEGLF